MVLALILCYCMFTKNDEKKSIALGDVAIKRVEREVVGVTDARVDTTEVLY